MGYRTMFLAGVLVGGLAAAGMMLYYAPASSKKMRARMLSRGMDLQDEAKDRAEELQKQARKLLKKQNKELRKRAMEVRGTAMDMAQEYRGRGRKEMKDRRKGLASLFAGSSKKLYDRMKG